MIKVIIAGTRDFDNYELLKQKMDKILAARVRNNEEIIIVSGTARGADKLGERYARERGYKIERYPANWDKHGKRAGYIRNEQMAKVADACVCFWDEQSKGTKHMIDLAKQYKLALRVINYNKYN
jgi:hypothetical protein